jgi:hypothetical protein
VHDELQSASALARGRRTDEDAVGVQKAIDPIGTGEWWAVPPRPDGVYEW